MKATVLSGILAATIALAAPAQADVDTGLVCLSPCHPAQPFASYRPL